MQDEYVLIDTAILACQKGFKTPTNSDKQYFDIVRKISHELKWFNHEEIPYLIEHPTQSLLQRWFREKHNIHISITRGGHIDTYNVFIFDYIYSGHNTIKEYNSYEEALEDGLIVTLKKLEDE